jgi:uncharacterized BrkB/YihY/UPF0761 family membrane protein
MAFNIELFKQIQSSDIGRALSAQNHLFGAFYQLIHIIGLLTLLTSLLLLVFRVFGGGIRHQSLSQLLPISNLLVIIGLALLAFSGLLIFIPAATNYYPNSVFWGKFILLALAIALQFGISRYLARIQHEPELGVKAISLFTLAVWFSVAFAGRFIGFVGG